MATECCQIARKWKDQEEDDALRIPRRRSVRGHQARDGRALPAAVRQMDRKVALCTDLVTKNQHRSQAKKARRKKTSLYEVPTNPQKMEAPGQSNAMCLNGLKAPPNERQMTRGYTEETHSVKRYSPLERDTGLVRRKQTIRLRSRPRKNANDP